MIVYRIQVNTGKDWTTMWVAGSAAARKLAKSLAAKHPSDTVYLDRVRIEPGREGVCEALNTATANRSTPGACAYEPVWGRRSSQ